MLNYLRNARFTNAANMEFGMAQDSTRLYIQVQEYYFCSKISRLRGAGTVQLISVYCAMFDRTTMYSIFAQIHLTEFLFRIY